MAILGLVNSETFESYRDKDFRRRIFYEYPEGGFPITALLSLMDSEETVDPEFSHWEKRVKQRRTLTASHGSSKGPFMTSAGSDGGDPISFTAGTSYRAAIDDATVFRVGSVVRFVLTNTSAATVTLYGIVTALTDTSSTPNVITFQALESLADVINGTTNENVDMEVLDIGSAYHEGRKDVTGESFEFPTRITNYTQIHRHPFSMTSTALTNPVLYDKTGGYRDKAKDASLVHMMGLESSAIFGRKREEAPSGAIDTATGGGLPRRFSGGLIYHMERWEAGDYGTVTATADTDIDKRIIENTAGTMSEDTYDDLMARLFSKGSGRVHERLCVCGWGALNVINRICKNKTTLNAGIPAKDTYGMRVVEHLTMNGTVYYKTHPLFNDNPIMRYWMLFIDVHSMKYRPLKNRDTKLLKMRQPNNADYREDEWLTEAGFEFWFPERFMLIKNVQTAIH